MVKQLARSLVLSVFLVWIGCGGDEVDGQACQPACEKWERCVRAEGGATSCELLPPGEPPPPADPTTYSPAEVCARYKQGRIITERSPVEPSAAQCEPGAVRQGAIDDTVARVNMYRWLVGLSPVEDDPLENEAAQRCSNLIAYFDFSSGGNPHHPEPSQTACYSQEGKATAGRSNLSWGTSTPAEAVDGFVKDRGNETTMGHRRWIFNPPLGVIGVGFVEGGVRYRYASCQPIFDRSGDGRRPPWTAFPNPGYTPEEFAHWTWTFQGELPGIQGASVSMERVSDGEPLGVRIIRLQPNFAQDAISWNPQGWLPIPGETYRVTIGLPDGEVSYEVTPLRCD